MFNIFSKKQKAKNLLDEFIFLLYGNPPPKARRADLDTAVALAHSSLLGRLVDLGDVRRKATALYEGDIPYTTYDLALATSLSFYKDMSYVPLLAEQQLLARFELLTWLEEKKQVHPFLVQSFENDVYKLYK